MIDNANTNMLTIANFTTSNGGDYTCTVTNDAGYDSDTITVYSKSIVCAINILEPITLLLHVYHNFKCIK